MAGQRSITGHNRNYPLAAIQPRVCFELILTVRQGNAGRAVFRSTRKNSRERVESISYTNHAASDYDRSWKGSSSLSSLFASIASDVHRLFPEFLFQSTSYICIYIFKFFLDFVYFDIKIWTLMQIYIYYFLLFLFPIWIKHALLFHPVLINRANVD